MQSWQNGELKKCKLAKWNFGKTESSQQILELTRQDKLQSQQNGRLVNWKFGKQTTGNIEVGKMGSLQNGKLT